MSQGMARLPVRKLSRGARFGRAQLDMLAVEEPLEVRLTWRERDAEQERPVAVTMRTPGHDAELAVGFLYTEGIVTRGQDVAGCEASGNVARVRLAAEGHVDLERLTRNFYVTSSCG